LAWQSQSDEGVAEILGGGSTLVLRSGFGDIVKTTVAIASFRVALLNTLSD
jgi:hypothetical protein